MTRTPLRFRALTVLLSALWISGCLTLQEDSDTELYIVLFWEDDNDGSRLDDETCESAGVDRVVWTLIREDSRGRSETVAESEADELCSNELIFSDVPPGEYTLEIRGDDERGSLEWAATCSPVYVDRFSEEHPCEVFLVDETGTARDPARRRPIDAGTPDDDTDAG